MDRSGIDHFSCRNCNGNGIESVVPLKSMYDLKKGWSKVKTLLQPFSCPWPTFYIYPLILGNNAIEHLHSNSDQIHRDGFDRVTRDK